jgi:hypothetical protein
MATTLIPYERQSLINDLKQHICEVHFTKVNGEQRRMRCTLDPSNIPVAMDPVYMDEQHKKKENEEIIAVWDLEAQGWRSFRVANVIYVQELAGG